jgi:serine/threonine protein kinase
LVELELWSAGRVIRGKYRVISKVGEGGMGAVYKASHVLFDEVRALKAMKRELMSDELLVKRFKQEAVMARKLHHPNAVSVHDLDEAEDGRPFIVMEFIEGQSLRDLIRGAGPLAPRRAAAIARQVAAALGAAHAMGMVHRDIKPANIVLVQTPEGEQAKVLDFGIAKLKEARAEVTSGLTLTGTGMVIGTPQYMSPEQAMGRRGSELDGRSDLYSLGVVLYQMLSGEVPFKADTTMGLLLAHINTAPTPILEARPDLLIPPALARVAMECLEKQPEGRPRDAATLVAAIERALEDETGTTTYAASAVIAPLTESTREGGAPGPLPAAATQEAPSSVPAALSPPPFASPGELPGAISGSIPLPRRVTVEEASAQFAVSERVETPPLAPTTSHVGGETPVLGRGRRFGWVAAFVVVLAALGWAAWQYRARHARQTALQPAVEQRPGPNPQTPPSNPAASEQANAPPSVETTPARPPAASPPSRPTETGKGGVEAPPSEASASQSGEAKPGVELPKLPAPVRSKAPPASSSSSTAAVAPSTPPPPAGGDLVVTTSPGAQVYLDGRLVGTADASGELHLASFPAGTYKIRVQLGTATSTEKPIRVIPDQTYFYTVGMPAPASGQPSVAPTTTAAAPPSLSAAPPSLSRATGAQALAGFPVSHRHTIGACKGTLFISGANILYRASDPKDSFSFALADVTFGLEGENEFFVQTKAGKKYVFRSAGYTQPVDIVGAMKQASASQ